MQIMSFFPCLAINIGLLKMIVIKIFFTGENLTPDFNACDYAIGFEWMDYGDRYFRYPLYLAYNNISEEMEHKHEALDGYSILEEKQYFCSFVYSNGRANSFRQKVV